MVAQLVGVSSHKPKGCGFDSSQGTCLGVGSVLVRVHGRSNQFMFSLTLMFLSLLSPLS